MPIYEFKCEECGKQFSLLRKMNEDLSGTVCPGCGSNRVSRLISACTIGSADGMSCSVGGG